MARIETPEAIMTYKLAKVYVDPSDVIALGNQMVKIGLDRMIVGGFWILDINGGIEFYSPEFRRVLGYEGEEDFPNVPESWQKAIDPYNQKEALEAFEKHMKDEKNSYYLPVVYNKKGGGKVGLYCAGSIVNRGDPNPIMLGTHEVDSKILREYQNRSKRSA